jgi:hypothetical protein
MKEVVERLEYIIKKLPEKVKLISEEQMVARLLISGRRKKSWATCVTQLPTTIIGSSKSNSRSSLL